MTKSRGGFDVSGSAIARMVAVLRAGLQDCVRSRSTASAGKCWNEPLLMAKCLLSFQAAYMIAEKPRLESARNTLSSTLSASASRRLTNKILRIIGAAHACVHRHLRIRAQRPRHLHTIVHYSRCDDLIRSGAGFPPPLDCSDRIKLIGARTTPAMRHARSEEHTSELQS